MKTKFAIIWKKFIKLSISKGVKRDTKERRERKLTAITGCFWTNKQPTLMLANNEVYLIFIHSLLYSQFETHNLICLSSVWFKISTFSKIHILCVCYDVIWSLFTHQMRSKCSFQSLFVCSLTCVYVVDSNFYVFALSNFIWKFVGICHTIFFSTFIWILKIKHTTRPTTLVSV